MDAGGGIDFELGADKRRLAAVSAGAVRIGAADAEVIALFVRIIRAAGSAAQGAKTVF